jgi:hypothetical protein
MKYDLTPGKLKSFLDNVRQRTAIYGWNDVVNVPTMQLAPGAGAPNMNNVINSYGTVTITECQAHATAYMTARGRTAQNAAMMYHFLFASLTQEARNKVNIDPTVFTILNISDGLCFLRTIIGKSQLDTIGTVETLRSRLGELPTKLVEMSGNIIDFHQHVNTVMNALDSYSQTYPEVILNLFKAYKQIEEREFATYIMITRHGYNANPAAYQPRTLMETVENHYKLAIESGTWEANMVNKESSEIAALRSEIEALKAHAVPNNGNRANNRGRQEKAKNMWKKIPPSEGESKTKIFETRTYHWCPTHHAWTMHTPAECKGLHYNKEQKEVVQPVPPQAMSSHIAPAPIVPLEVKVKEAMQTIVEYSEDYGH